VSARIRCANRVLAPAVSGHRTTLMRPNLSPNLQVSPSMKHLRLQLIGVLSAFAGIAGCSEPQTALSGKVTYKDKPVPGGSVVFVSSEDASKQARAEIKPDGMYSCSTVPLGNLKVAVLPAAKSASKMMPKGAKKPAIADDNPLSKVYGSGGAEYVNIPEALQNPETSKITVKVDADTKTFDIPLK